MSLQCRRMPPFLAIADFLRPAIARTRLNIHLRSEDFVRIVLRGDNGLLRLVVPIPGQSFMGNRSYNPIVIDLYARGIASGCGNVYAAAELSAPALLGIGISVPNSTIAWYGDEWSSPVSVGPFNKIYPSLILNSLIDRIDSQIRPLCDLVHQSLGETSSPAFNCHRDWISRFH